MGLYAVGLCGNRQCGFWGLRRVADAGQLIRRAGAGHIVDELALPNLSDGGSIDHRHAAAALAGAAAFSCCVSNLCLMALAV